MRAVGGGGGWMMTEVLADTVRLDLSVTARVRPQVVLVVFPAVLMSAVVLGSPVSTGLCPV